MGLAGAAQLALIVNISTEKGKTTTTSQYFVISRAGEDLSPIEFLRLRRRHWGIESVAHQRLDVSCHEDQSRVRTLGAAAMLGLLSRISLALFTRDCQRPQPARDKTYPIWSTRLQKKPRPILDQLLQPCLPP